MKYLRLLILYCAMNISLIALAISENIVTEMYQLPGEKLLNGVTVNSVCVDNRGRTWLGTENGLLINDGYHVVSLPLTRNLLQSDISALFPKDDDIMLVGSDKGLFAVDAANGFESVQVSPLSVTKVLDITQGFGSLIAAAASESVYLFDENSQLVDSIKIKDDKGQYITPLSVLFRGNVLYVGTSLGLYALDLKNRSLPDIISGVAYINDMIDCGNCILLASTRQGLWRYDIIDGSSRRLSLESNVIMSLTKDSMGKVYVGTDGDGVYLYNPSTDRVEKYLDSTPAFGRLPNNQVYALDIGPRDELFVGLYRGGAAYTHKKSTLFDPYNLGDVFDTSQMSVRAIEKIPGYLAIGTRDGVYLLSDDENTPIHIGKKDLRSNLVLALYYYGERLFIGTYGGGLSVYDLATGQISNLIATSASLATNGSVFAMDQDADGSLWIGASDGLYKVIDTKAVDYISCVDMGLQGGSVMELFFDKMGRGWICTQQGMSLFDPKRRSFDAHTFPDGFINDVDIRNIYESSNGNLFFIANKGDIWCFTPQLELAPISKMLKEVSTVRGIKQDHKGRLWLASSDGIVVINLSDNNFVRYDHADGLQSDAFNLCEPLLDDKGMMWFGNSKGLLALDTNAPIKNALSDYKPLPIVVAFNGEEMLLPLSSTSNSPVNIDLPHYSESVQLIFSDFAYIGPRNDRYEYSLNDSGQWRLLPDDLTLTLSVAEGENSLLLRQRGNTATETAVIIHNPYAWPSIIIYVSFVVIIVLVAAIIAMVIIHKRKTRHEQAAPILENIIDESDDIAETSADMPKKYAANYIPKSECEKIAEQLANILAAEKLYINPDLKIGDLAHKLGVSSHKLSYLFGQHLNTGYYDYIYQFRVAEFKRLALEDTLGKYTLTALSEMAGFNSRATFFRIFKKNEGLTPGDYLRQIRHSN